MSKKNEYNPDFTNDENETLLRVFNNKTKTNI
jgi:hypothetical protein